MAGGGGKPGEIRTVGAGDDPLHYRSIAGDDAARHRIANVRRGREEPLEMGPDLVRPPSSKAKGRLLPEPIVGEEGEEPVRIAGVEGGQPLFEERGKGGRRGGRARLLGSGGEWCASGQDEGENEPQGEEMTAEHGGLL